MERGRGGRGRGAKKRATLPPQYIFADLAPPTTPDSSTPPQRMPNTTPLRGGKARLANPTPHRSSSPAAEQALRQGLTPRAGRSATFHSSFSFESPSASGAIMAASAPSARKRSRTFEMPFDGAADEEAHSKGGHSLRKRARIDYTQEMIDDDLGLSAARSDLISKSTTTPSARGRKRKSAQDDSGDESEDVGPNPKRHRADKSPARAASARRRNTSRKPATDLSSYVDQPSDNDVQDTILVNVSMDQAPSDGESDHSSFAESESRPTSSDESDTARAQVQPPTPQVQPAQSIKDAVSLAPEDDEAIDKDLIPEQPDDKPRIPPAQISLTPDPSQLDHPSDKESRRMVVVSKVAVAPESTSTRGFEEKLVDESPDGQSPLDHQRTAELKRERVPEVEFENVEPSAPVVEEPKALDESPAPLASEAEEVSSPKPIIPQQVPYQSPSTTKQSGPARLKSLESIYRTETPFATHSKLTPYEEEDIILPGPYTEWVYPVDSSKEKSEPTLIPTPTSTPCPLERAAVGFEWDARRPLKTKEFFTLYRQETKRREEKGEPPISMIEFNNECVRRYKSAKNQAAALDTSASLDKATGFNASAVRRAAPVTAASVEEAQGSQPAESRPPTAAPSPVPADEDVIQEDGGEEEQEQEETVDDNIKSYNPAEPVEVTRNPSKQYSFPKLRDPSELIDALEGFQDMENEVLYHKVAAAVEALDCYQQEYNELKKILDDEENAKRRQANDKTIVNWENRQKADEPPHWRRHFDDLVKGPTPFEHQREEDRIMAQAYGFKHNNHPTQVGRQNPEEQRWEMPETRLRERKRTEKGAELAEENVIEGKRVRKPRYVSDQSKDPSRSGTPTGSTIFGTARRPIHKRRPAVSAANEDEAEGSEQAQLTESFAGTPRKGRATRARTLILYDQDQAIHPAEVDSNQTEDEEVEEKPKGHRRRGRGAASASAAEPPTSVPARYGTETTKPNRLRGSRNHQAYPAAEIASSSFYSNVSTTATQPDSRPSTASSEATTHTAETVESAYSLRDKRRRNFVLENDPELEPRTQRRGRGAAAQKQTNTEPKKRAQRKKEAAGHPPPLPAAASTSTIAPSGPALQSVGAPVYHKFMPGPVFIDMANASHPVPALAQAQAPAQTSGPFLHTFNAAPAFPPGVPPPPPPPPAVKKPITKIKLTNNGSSSQASSRAATPANGTSTPKSGAKGPRGNKSNSSVDAKSAASTSGNGDYDKPYAEMSKSEKMSWSMRRRWASGEMQGAVEKRRTTLANKKAEKAANSTASGAVDPNIPGQTTEPGSAAPLGPTTPTAMSGQSGPLALPQGPRPLQAPPQPQGILQQPPISYTISPGGPPGPVA
ncbi:hypothetical protein MMYC01_205456 [Madurella mycetomatis]|uniref:Uncharacterized protein n=1 Tax=Madurella mycetomatis TaxID=100816 RepID=A0A175W0M1_9PEZI|nr:hypothetical protein MMYC01_205456 [Madurella mycetomatis]